MIVIVYLTPPPVGKSEHSLKGPILESEAFRTRHEVPREKKKETRDETDHHVTRGMWTIAYR